jgi:parvulin-like peptidyl-prolyl isomerase
MMQSLRDNMKLIIWITAIVFLVGFGVLELGGVLGQDPAQQQGRSGIIAEINGEPVRYEEYVQTVNQMTRQLQQTRELQPGEDAYIREQAWQTLVRNKLLIQEARRRKLQATPDEIKMALRVAPPEFLIQSEGFKTNGQFDYRKYLAELDNPNSQVPWGQVEALVAENLPIQKLQEQVVAAAKVSEGDVRDRFLLQNENIKFRGVIFHPDSFPVDTTRIGGADVEAYYKAHPEEFTGPEEVKISVILIPRKPDPSDFSAEKERLRGVLDMARAQPDSFASLARTYSVLQTASNGGDPGTEPYLDEMRPAFRQGLRNVGPGQISDVLQEEKSLHLFKVEKRYVDPKTKRERIKYREIAVRVEPGANAVRAMRELVGKAEKDAKKSGLDPVATKMGLRSFTSEWFSYGQSGNEVLQRFPEVENWMFRSKPGDVSAGVPTENGHFIFQIADKRSKGTRPLNRMQAEAKAKLIRSLQMQRAKEAAQQARAMLAAGAKETEVAARLRGKVVNGEGVTRNGFIPGVGQREPRVVGALFAMAPNTWTPPLVGEGGVFVALVEGHNLPTEEEYKKQEQQVRESLLGERRQVLFVEWMQDLRRHAKIKDFRGQYFET